MVLGSRTHTFGTLALLITTLFGGLLLLGQFSLELFFILSFISLLVVMQLFAPIDQRPVWWRYLRVTAVTGFFVFGYILYRHITTVL